MYLQPGGAISTTATTAAVTRRCSAAAPLKFTHPVPPLFSHRRRKFQFPTTTAATITLKQPPSALNATDVSKSQNNSATTSFGGGDEVRVVGDESVPLEGVIQFEKPDSGSNIRKWGQVGLLAGGDVLAILLFSAIGRFSHGFSAFDTETIRIADPFIAGWILSAYFLGGYGEDGRGVNGRTSAITAAVKSWALGIPLGLVIRTATIGHIPPMNFILVTMGSTALLLIGWRGLISSIFGGDNSKKSDVYKRGSPFELFELLTSLVRRW